MSSRVNDNPRPSCDFCGNYATAECDAWNRQTNTSCGLLVCHQHRYKARGIDCCPKHAQQRAKHPVKAVPADPGQASFNF